MKPIIGPECWEDTPKPKHWRHNVMIHISRPRKKSNNENDVPNDLTKLKKQNIKVHFTSTKLVVIIREVVQHK